MRQRNSVLVLVIGFPGWGSKRRTIGLSSMCQACTACPHVATVSPPPPLLSLHGSTYGCAYKGIQRDAWRHSTQRHPEQQHRRWPRRSPPPLTSSPSRTLSPSASNWNSTRRGLSSALLQDISPNSTPQQSQHEVLFSDPLRCHHPLPPQGSRKACSWRFPVVSDQQHCGQIRKNPLQDT